MDTVQNVEVTPPSAAASANGSRPEEDEESTDWESQNSEEDHVELTTTYGNYVMIFGSRKMAHIRAKRKWSGTQWECEDCSNINSILDNPCAACGILDLDLTEIGDGEAVVEARKQAMEERRQLEEKKKKEAEEKAKRDAEARAKLKQMRRKRADLESELEEMKRLLRMKEAKRQGQPIPSSPAPRKPSGTSRSPATPSSLTTPPPPSTPPDEVPEGPELPPHLLEARRNSSGIPTLTTPPPAPPPTPASAALTPTTPSQPVAAEEKPPSPPPSLPDPKPGIPTTPAASASAVTPERLSTAERPDISPATPTVPVKPPVVLSPVQPPIISTVTSPPSSAATKREDKRNDRREFRVEDRKDKGEPHKKEEKHEVKSPAPSGTNTMEGLRTLISTSSDLAEGRAPRLSGSKRTLDADNRDDSSKTRRVDPSPTASTSTSRSRSSRMRMDMLDSDRPVATRHSPAEATTRRRSESPVRKITKRGRGSTKYSSSSDRDLESRWVEASEDRKGRSSMAVVTSASGKKIFQNKRRDSTYLQREGDEGYDEGGRKSHKELQTPEDIPVRTADGAFRVPDGAVKHIATGGGKRPWANPYHDGLINASASTTGHGDVSQVLNLTYNEDALFATSGDHLETGKASYVAFDFTDWEVMPTEYSLAHSWGYPLNYMRSWSLRGSEDNYRWDILSKHTNDETLREGHEVATFPIPQLEKPKFYRYFMIRLEPKGNSRGTSQLVINCFELFGFLRRRRDKGS